MAPCLDAWPYHVVYTCTLLVDFLFQLGTLTIAAGAHTKQAFAIAVDIALTWLIKSYCCCLCGYCS